MTEKAGAPLETGENVCRSIGQLIGGKMPHGWGFALILFRFGENGVSMYVSNDRREDMIKALRECAEKLEKREDNL